MSRWGSRYSMFPQYVSVGEMAEKSAKIVARMRKQGEDLKPVVLKGRTIAKTFWGKAWCKNIESYRDLAYRLERGRRYVRSNAVIDLKISKGRVTALVVGSGRTPYKISIKIDPIAKHVWEDVKKDCMGKINSILALAQGKLPAEVVERFCRQGDGLFPTPKQIHFDCSCPDYADCCKHVAATLYGIGARLDEEPSLFFTLCGIDESELLGADVVAALTEPAEPAAALDDSSLGDVFGIDLSDDVGEVEAPVQAPKKKRGRPRKVATPAAEVVVVGETPKKKRGRPRKNA